MAAMRDIKRRNESIRNIQQITKAMKLVSTVKLQRAKGRAESVRLYADKIYAMAVSMLRKAEDTNLSYLKKKESSKNGVIVISGNRGLAGGYHHNIVKAVMEQNLTPKNTLVYGVGKKGSDLLKRKGYTIAAEADQMIDDPCFEDAQALGKSLLDAYEEGEIGKIYLAYTRFKNAVTHIPTVIQLLPPTSLAEQDRKEETYMDFEPEVDEMLKTVIPKYISSFLYSAIAESVASENGARIQAMDLATSNAEEMINELSLAYNRARQGAITQELTEIISGAEALG